MPELCGFDHRPLGLCPPQSSIADAAPIPHGKPGKKATAGAFGRGAFFLLVVRKSSVYLELEDGDCPWKSGGHFAQRSFSLCFITTRACELGWRPRLTPSRLLPPPRGGWPPNWHHGAVSIRTVLRTCTALISHLFRTCSALVPSLFTLHLHRALHDGRPGFWFLVLTGACEFGHGAGEQMRTLRPNVTSLAPKLERTLLKPPIQ